MGAPLIVGDSQIKDIDEANIKVLVNSKILVSVVEQGFCPSLKGRSKLQLKSLILAQIERWRYA